MIEYVKKEKKRDENFQKVYALIFRQCTKHMRSKIEAQQDYQSMRGDYNVFLLVRGIVFGRHKHPLHTIHDAKRDFYH